MIADSFSAGRRIVFPHFLLGNEKKQKNPVNPACQVVALAKFGKSCLPRLLNLPNLPNEIFVALISSG
jgi:hypothetical protein